MNSKPRAGQMLATAGLAAATVLREADMRLDGQVHALRVPVPGGVLDLESAPALTDNFAAAYRRLYARDPFGGELEIISWHVTCNGPSLPLGAVNLTRASAPPRPARQRQVWFPETGGFVTAVVHSR